MLSATNLRVKLNFMDNRIYLKDYIGCLDYSNTANINNKTESDNINIVETTTEIKDNVKTTKVKVTRTKKSNLSKRKLREIKKKKQKTNKLRSLEKAMEQFYNIHALNVDASKRVIFFTLDTRYAIKNREDMLELADRYIKILNHHICGSNESKLRIAFVIEQHKDGNLHLHGFMYNAPTYAYALIQQRTNRMFDRYCMEHEIPLKPRRKGMESTSNNNVWIRNDILDVTDEKGVKQTKEYVSKYVEKQLRDAKFKIEQKDNKKILKELKSKQFFFYTRECKELEKNYTFDFFLHDNQKEDFFNRLSEFLRDYKYKKEVKTVTTNKKEYTNVYNHISCSFDKEDLEEITTILSKFTKVTAVNLSRMALRKNNNALDFNYKKYYEQIKDYKECVFYNLFLKEDLGLNDEELFELAS